jgi:hypothetical protein
MIKEEYFNIMKAVSLGFPPKADLPMADNHIDFTVDSFPAIGGMGMGNRSQDPDFGQGWMTP